MNNRTFDDKTYLTENGLANDNDKIIVPDDLKTVPLTENEIDELVGITSEGAIDDTVLSQALADALEYDVFLFQLLNAVTV